MEKETLGAVGATGVGIEVFADSGTGRLAGKVLGGGVGCNVRIQSRFGGPMLGLRVGLGFQCGNSGWEKECGWDRLEIHIKVSLYM